MIYQYDQAVQLPVKDLYDTQVMQMAIAAAKDMYEKGEKQIKDFYDKYGDFITPIYKDQENYNAYIDNIRKTIDDIYASGDDPLRSVSGRARVAQALRSVPYKELANIKQSAKNAEMYNKAKLALQQQGLYNPDLDPYGGGTPDTWDTVGSGKIFDVLSPTPYQNLSDFSKAYFDGIKPSIHKESKNGIDYQVEEITEGDIRRIADAKFNDLSNTPQGRLMYQRFLDIAGGDVDKARQMFNDSIVDANLKRVYHHDNYDDNYYKAADLALKKQQLAASIRNADLDRELKYEIAKLGANGKSSSSKSGSGSGGDDDNNWSEDQWQLAKGVTSAIASTSIGQENGVVDYSDFDPIGMSAMWPQAYDEIIDRAYSKVFNAHPEWSATVSMENLVPDTGLNINRVSVGDNKETRFVLPNTSRNMFNNLMYPENLLGSNGLPSYEIDKSTGAFHSENYKPNVSTMNRIVDKKGLWDLRAANKNLINSLATDYDPVKFAEWTRLKTSNDDNTLIHILPNSAVINRLYSIDEVSMNSSGLNFHPENLKKASDETKGLRKALNKFKGNDAGNLRLQSIGKCVTMLDSDGVTHLYQLCRVVSESRGTKSRGVSKISLGDIIDEEQNGIILYDMGIPTRKNPNYGIDGNRMANLFIDDNRDGDIRLSGNIGAGTFLHLGAPKLNMTTSFPR